MKPQTWLILGLVLLLRIPFLYQAIQGDDAKYITMAEHAQIDPLHPKNMRYVFEGKVVDMRGHPHPPLNIWALGALLAALGDVREVPFHAAYIVFSVIAVLSMWSLARRFSPRPVLATLLFLSTPAFVVNGGSLESDLPVLAFWMASIALFTAKWDMSPKEQSCSFQPGPASGRWSPTPDLSTALACLCLALAVMAAYQSIVLAPILAVYLWFHRRRWRAGWIALAVVPLALVAWQAWERAYTGALPAAVVAGYFKTYHNQSLLNKLRNATALTAHAGWLVFPGLVLAAFWRWWPVALVAAAAGFVLDANPLFWASFALGALLLVALAARRPTFLSAWVVLYFAAALAAFFAGSARYLLPMAAPVALLVVEKLKDRPRWLAAGFAIQMALSLCLALVNYQHWDGYRRVARALAGQAARSRVWTNGEWGLRFYFESAGALPLVEGQAVQPGEMVVSSELAYPVSCTTGGGRLTPAGEWEIRPTLPFRLVGLGARSAWSSVSFGFRPFDLSTAPVDRVRSSVVVAEEPALSYLPMNAPEADSQIASGIYRLEENRYRWTAEHAVVLLKSPPQAAPLEVTFFIADAAPARRIALWLDGAPLVERTFPAPGLYTLASPPVLPAQPSASAALTVDKTFAPPGDQRVLGVILSGIGFRK